MKIKTLYKRIRAFFPEKLPQGVSEFEAWAADILTIYKMPDNDSSRFALAVMIMHLGPTEVYKSKEYFGRSLMKTAANQIAHQLMSDLKEKQKREAVEAAANAAQQKSEATALEVASDGPQK